MDINLDPRYQNHWLDLARKEKVEKEKARNESLAEILTAIDSIINKIIYP